MAQNLQALNVQNKMAEWAARISERRSSGQSIKSWCKENGVCEQTYYKWQRKLFSLAKAQQEAQFAEVTPLHDQCRSGDIAVTVRLAGGAVDIHAGADAGTIETVLRIHGSAPGNRWIGLHCRSTIQDGSVRGSDVVQF